MENKQGCVDWLVEEINKQKAWADPSKLEPIIQQAKAMHKEECAEVFKEAQECAIKHDGVYFKYNSIEDYYKSKETELESLPCEH